MAGSSSRLLKVERTGRFAFAALALAACLPVAAQIPTGTQGPALKATVNRVNVGVAVTDSHGKFVAGLAKEDFQVFDNDIEQPIIDFLPIEEPAQFLLLVESGPSVFLFAKNHILAADMLLGQLLPDDRVAIATYSKNAQLILGFTTDKALARTTLHSIDFHSGFGELDLSTSIVSAVRWLAQSPGKKAVVLLSTGVDSPGLENGDALRSDLETADIKIIAVSLSADIRKAAKRRKLNSEEQEARRKLREEFNVADQSLRALSAATGGRTYFAQNSGEFARAYSEIAQLLRHEYSLAFVPPVADGKVHTLRVKVRGAGYSVENRPAYQAAPPLSESR